jgi:uncharacterized protein YggE
MFTIDDPAPARAEAIDEAVADARKTAEAMAEAAGTARDVPIEPGQLDISANVVVVFALE